MRKEQLKTLGVWVLGIIGAYFIVGVLVMDVLIATFPRPVGVDRMLERKRALAEVRAAEQRELNTHGLLDATKGLYRLKIDQAMTLTQTWYQDPAAARSNLISRAEKASFVPPPPTFE